MRRRWACWASAGSASWWRRGRKAFGMHIVAYDPFVGSERFRELGVEKAETPADLYRQADFITLHLPKTAETRGWLDAEALAQCRDGVRVINCARGELVDDAALKDALDSGKVAGAALDVFPSEPITDYPLFGLSQRRRHAAPRRLDDRGAGPRGRADRRADDRGAHRRGRLHRGQHPGDRAGGHGRARPVHPAGRPAGPAGRRARRGLGHRSRRGRVLRPDRGARHAPAHARRAPGRAGRALRGGGQPRQRRRRWPRSAASASPSARRSRRATSPTSSASRSSPAASASASPARRSAARSARTCSRRGASASTCSSTRARTSPCSATATCRA